MAAPSFTQQSEGDCGRTAHDEAGDRIVGGERSEPGRHPWAAALMLGSFQYCAGSLINKKVLAW